MGRTFPTVITILSNAYKSAANLLQKSTYSKCPLAHQSFIPFFFALLLLIFSKVTVIVKFLDKIASVIKYKKIKIQDNSRKKGFQFLDHSIIMKEAVSETIFVKDYGIFYILQQIFKQTFFNEIRKKEKKFIYRFQFNIVDFLRLISLEILQQLIMDYFQSCFI